VWQLFQLLDLFLRSQVQFVQLLDLLLEDVSVDCLPTRLLLLLHRPFPLLLNALQKLHLPLVLAQAKLQVHHVLPLCF
jgi:hypothetical protein